MSGVYTNRKAPKDLCAQNIRENRKSGSSYSGFSVINKGGMGVVLKATDINSGRLVAMKMASHSEEDDEVFARFLHEAKITANLEHPNIVPIHEINCDDQDNVYFTMKYIQGDDFETILKKLELQDPKYIKAYPLSRLLTIFMSVCDGLSFAHSKGVIHRDLKPENIMIGNYSEVLIMDWGISKTLDDEPTNGNSEIDNRFLHRHFEGKKEFKSTHFGEVFGTPAFMAPEQILGKNDQVDQRADIYAMGGLLYNILTLRLPVIEDDLKELFSKVVAGDICAPADLPCSKKGKLPHIQGSIPDALSAVAMKALSLQPVERYTCVLDLKNDILAYNMGYATTAEKASGFKKMSLMFNRNAFFCTLLIFIFSTAIFTFMKDRKTALGARALEEEFSQNLIDMNARHNSTRKELSDIHQKLHKMTDQAELLINQKEYEKAKGIINLITSLNPKNHRLFYLKGLIQEKQNKYNQALVLYRQALSRSARNKKALIALERCILQINKN